jgi:hypothetical protein
MLSGFERGVFIQYFLSPYFQHCLILNRPVSPQYVLSRIKVLRVKEQLTGPRELNGPLLT